MHYPSIMDELKMRLEERVESGKIKKKTMDTYLNDANRVFEAALRGISEEGLEALTATWFGGPYGHLIQELKQIADEREREIHRG